MGYESISLNQDIVIDRIVSVHYFEYTSDFFFPGEAHDFWEFLYVDKGEVDVTAGNICHVLKKGEIVFHKPMEFHNLWANGVIAPNLVVISFESDSKAMEFFENKILRVGDSERNLLAGVISEAQEAFSSPLDDPWLTKLERKSRQVFGAEQMIRINLEQLLIQLIRKAETHQVSMKTTSSIKEKIDQHIFNKVVLYLEENVCNRLTLNEICMNNQVGNSYLQKLFHLKTGGGVMEYFGRLRIELAKRYIRQNSHNFTEIAEITGYSSIHYFSRHFKKVTGMTPTEYATSVKIRSEISKERLNLLKDH